MYKCNVLVLYAVITKSAHIRTLHVFMDLTSELLESKQKICLNFIRPWITGHSMQLYIEL